MNYKALELNAKPGHEKWVVMYKGNVIKTFTGKFADRDALDYVSGAVHESRLP